MPTSLRGEERIIDFAPGCRVSWLRRLFKSINYANFKDQIDDMKRHNALLKVWQAMYAYQEAVHHE